MKPPSRPLLLALAAALAAGAAPLAGQPPGPEPRSAWEDGLPVIVVDDLGPMEGCGAHFLARRDPRVPAPTGGTAPVWWSGAPREMMVCVRPNARVGGGDDAAPDGAPGSEPQEAGAVSLFNGRDLTGWRVHGTERWYVEDGELVCESGPDAAYGYLATERTYRDFVLTLEFKQEADGNSGVFFRSRLEGTRVNGWQVEVAPSGLWTGGIYESYGRGWLVRPDPALDETLRMGEWNELRVEVVGDRVRTWLNGVAMVELADETIGRADGVIALQIHDGGGIKVRWRNLRLRELSAG